MRRYLSAVLTLSACLTFTVISADTTDFRVDSYIPDQYHDLRWLIGGGFNLGGDNNESVDHTPNSAVVVDRNGSGSRQSFNLHSVAGYRYFSVPQFLNLDVDGTIAGTWRSNSSNYISRDPLGLNLSSQTEYDDHFYQYRLDGSASAGRYLVGDLYVSPTVNLQVMQNEATRNESSRNQLFIDTILNRVRIERIGEFYDSPDVRREREIRLQAGIGYGRVYDGRFAAHAMEMVASLKHAGLLLREPSFNDLEGLTQIIYFRRQESPIDSRYQRIDVLKELAGHLSRQGVIDSDPAPVIPYLQDIWDYYDQNTRRFGWQVQTDLGVAYSDRRVDATFESDRYRLRYEYDVGNPAVRDTIYEIISRAHEQEYDREQWREVFVELKTNYYKPLSLRWQFDCEALVNYALVSSHDETQRRMDFVSGLSRVEHSEDDVSQWQKWWLQPTIRYIYDRRTSIELFARASYEVGYTPPIRIPIRRIDRDGYVAELGTNVVYRISVPTTVQVRLTSYYWDRYYDSGDRFIERSYTIDASVEHYLF